MPMDAGLSSDDLFQHFAAFGESGTGKSSFLANLARSIFRQGWGGCVIDYHGDLITNIIAGLPPERLAEVILVDITDWEFPVGLSLCEVEGPHTIERVAATASFVGHLFEVLFGAGLATSPRLLEVLRAVVRTLIEVSPEVATFTEMPLIFSSDTAREKVVSRLKNPAVVLFWEAYARLSTREKNELVESTRNKITAFTDEQLVSNVIGQGKSTINLTRAMREGKILLVKLSPLYEQASQLVGGSILAKLLMAGFAQASLPERERRPFLLMVDEFQRVAAGSSDMKTFIHEARKARVATILATQSLQSLDEETRAAALACGNIMCFRVSGLDAPILAKSFNASPQQVEREIIGSEPVRVPCSDVVGHLERSGHSNAVIAQWVSDWLIPLASMIRAISSSMHPIHLGRVNAMFRHGDAIQGRMLLNEALSACQRTGRAEVAIDPLALFMLGAASSAKSTEVFADELKRTDWHGGFFHGFQDRAYSLGHPSLLTDQEKLGHFLSIHGPGFWDSLLGRKTITPGQAFIRMLKALRGVMAILAREPILVDTGQYTAKYQIRTYADVENQLANELSQLPNFYARVRFVSTGEQVVKTKPLPPLLSGAALEARIQAIKRRNWEQGYTRYYKDVEKDIRERQERLKRPVSEKQRSNRRAGDPPPTSS
jgi:hypothetical protein